MSINDNFTALSNLSVLRLEVCQKKHMACVKKVLFTDSTLPPYPFVVFANSLILTLSHVHFCYVIYKHSNPFKGLGVDQKTWFEPYSYHTKWFGIAISGVIANLGPKEPWNSGDPLWKFLKLYVPNYAF